MRYPGRDDPCEWDHTLTPDSPPQLEVTVTEPEVMAMLLGPDGEPIMVILDREPVGFYAGRW